jgi:tRNA A-37 threonylcarbamoyl transferase component Bud32
MRNPPDPNLGRTLLGQFVLREKLGEGGMGAVYLAEQPTVGRRAVVKLLQPRLAGDPEIAARFNLEARAAAALNHPHIVTVYNYGADDGALVLAMEHLEGRDLERRLAAEGPLLPARAVHVARQICDALAEAHRRGVVHRDLKPSNVMLVTRGRDADFVKVLDFGIAKVEGVTITGGGTVFGTPEYMSPEQLRAEPLDGRSDLYALGVLLFEIIAGRLPFSGATPEAQMQAHLQQLPPSLLEAAPQAGVSPALAALVAQLMAKDRAARPADADAAAEALAALAGAPEAAAGGARRAGAAGDGAGLPAWQLAALFAVLLATAIGLLVLLRPSGEPAGSAPAGTTSAAAHPAPAASAATPSGAAPSASGESAPASLASADPSLPPLRALEKQFLIMPVRGSMSWADRRAILRSLYARIDAGEGDEAARELRKRIAVRELIRQQLR